MTTAVEDLLEWLHEGWQFTKDEWEELQGLIGAVMREEQQRTENLIKMTACLSDHERFHLRG